MAAEGAVRYLLANHYAGRVTTATHCTRPSPTVSEHIEKKMLNYLQVRASQTKDTFPLYMNTTCTMILRSSRLMACRSPSRTMLPFHLSILARQNYPMGTMNPSKSSSVRSQPRAAQTPSYRPTEPHVKPPLRIWTTYSTARAISFQRQFLTFISAPSTCSD